MNGRARVQLSSFLFGSLSLSLSATYALTKLD